MGAWGTDGRTLSMCMTQRRKISIIEKKKWATTKVVICLCVWKVNYNYMNYKRMRDRMWLGMKTCWKDTSSSLDERDRRVKEWQQFVYVTMVWNVYQRMNYTEEYTEEKRGMGAWGTDGRTLSMCMTQISVTEKKKWATTMGVICLCVWIINVGGRIRGMGGWGMKNWQ